MYFNIDAMRLRKIIDLPEKRITKTVFIEDIDDLIVHMHRWE